VNRVELPTLFIASSTEGLGIAYDVQEALEFDCLSTVWPQGVFQPSHHVLQDLMASLSRHAFALFVFSPDDEMTIRGQKLHAVRDNVIFEMGLFVGALGLEHCAHLVPRARDKLRLPSDLLGLVALEYDAERPDNNRLAALGPACNKLRRLLRQPKHSSSAPEKGAAMQTALERSVFQWQSAPLTQDRQLLRSGIVHDPRDLDFPRQSVLRVFNFLEAVSSAVLDGDLVEAEARALFGDSLLSFWPFACVTLAPPDHGGEAWEPQPAMARIYQRWLATAQR
jgi:Predicted nucleotide-binding protein containing TIR-like domain